MRAIGRRCHELRVVDGDLNLMIDSKKKRLEKAGWTYGDAADFLNLSPEEAAFVEIKITLSRGLKALRTRQKLTQVSLASRLGSSQSRIAKAEAGDASVSLDLLIRSLLTLGASNHDLADLISSSTQG